MKTDNMMSRIKRFGCDHKKGLITGSMVASGVVLTILGCKHLPKKPASNLIPLKSSIKDVAIPEGLKVWTTTALWTEDGYLNAIVESIPMDDLGELGLQYIENGLAEPGDIATLVIGVKNQ